MSPLCHNVLMSVYLRYKARWAGGRRLRVNKNLQIGTFLSCWRIRRLRLEPSRMFLGDDAICTACSEIEASHDKTLRYKMTLILGFFAAAVGIHKTPAATSNVRQQHISIVVTRSTRKLVPSTEDSSQKLENLYLEIVEYSICR